MTVAVLAAFTCLVMATFWAVILAVAGVWLAADWACARIRQARQEREIRAAVRRLDAGLEELTGR